MSLSVGYDKIAKKIGSFGDLGVYKALKSETRGMGLYEERGSCH